MALELMGRIADELRELQGMVERQRATETALAALQREVAGLRRRLDEAERGWRVAESPADGIEPAGASSLPRGLGIRLPRYVARRVSKGRPYFYWVPQGPGKESFRIVKLDPDTLLERAEALNAELDAWRAAQDTAAAVPGPAEAQEEAPAVREEAPPVQEEAGPLREPEPAETAAPKCQAVPPTPRADYGRRGNAAAKRAAEARRRGFKADELLALEAFPAERITKAPKRPRFEGNGRIGGADSGYIDI